MIITFINWAKHQPRKDLKKPWYMAFQNDFFLDSKMYALDNEERLCLIYLLCEASRANNSGTFQIIREHYRVHSRLTDRVLDRTIEKLFELRVIKQPRVRGTYVSCTPSVQQNRIEERRIEENRTKAAAIEPEKREPRTDVNVVALWCDEYKKEYGTKYEILKKDAGILKGFGKDRGRDKIQTLFACYLAIKDQLYVSQKHPLSLFFRDLPKINAAAQTGIDPSSSTNVLDEWAKNRQPQIEGGK